MDEFFAKLTNGQGINRAIDRLAAGVSITHSGTASTPTLLIAARFTGEGRRNTLQKARNMSQAHVLVKTYLEGGTFFDVEFDVRHGATP